MNHPISLDMILAKSLDSGGTTLVKHLQEVADAAVLIASHCEMDKETARIGGLLHDIGKTSDIFQKTLKPRYVRRPGLVWRHEIASLFFISLAPKEKRPQIVDMIVGHHKSVSDDVSEKGLLDLEDYDDDCFETHYQGFEKWSITALEILASLGMETHEINEDEAFGNYQFAVEHCRKKSQGCSMWKGLLMAADHLVSAVDPNYREIAPRLFIKPDLSFYNRSHELYPLSLIATDNKRKHTLVTAPTGAGKTDFLLRRCKGRVFYILPFQASINAMYDRIREDLKDTDAEVTLLHAISDLKIFDGKLEERIMQHHVGASIKVMTPHQMASIVFGIKGYETMAVDLRGCDVIMDEIHTYTSKMQAIVCRIIEILVAFGCRIHIGTATMPTVLYDRILKLLGGKAEVYEVKLPKEILSSFNRHVIHKCTSIDKIWDLLNECIQNQQKILIVCNQVKRAQACYKVICDKYPEIDHMLIHSRFKRGKRNDLEQILRNKFNNSPEACIVVSTQVVEVSLDISFDIMITECAPIDAMIQRFGRINRKRNKQTIGHFKPIYVLEPPKDEKDALPYDIDVLKSSYEALPNNEILKESCLQSLIDKVYPNDNFINIDYSGVIYADGVWLLKELNHRSKSALLDVMDFNSAVCVLESDEENYRMGDRRTSMQLEIPVSYKSVAYRGLKQLDIKSRPFIIADEAYNDEMGIQTDKLNNERCKNFEIL